MALERTSKPEVPRLVRQLRHFEHEERRSAAIGKSLRELKSGLPRIKGAATRQLVEHEIHELEKSR